MCHHSGVATIHQIVHRIRKPSDGMGLVDPVIKNADLACHRPLATDAVVAHEFVATTSPMSVSTSPMSVSLRSCGTEFRPPHLLSYEISFFFISLCTPQTCAYVATIVQVDLRDSRPPCLILTDIDLTLKGVWARLYDPCATLYLPRWNPLCAQEAFCSARLGASWSCPTGIFFYFLLYKD